MAADAGSRRSFPRNAAEDDLRRWDDEADFPAWLSERPPDASDLHRMSAQDHGRDWIWFVAIVGLGVVAVATAMARPAVISGLLDRMFGSGKSLAVQHVIAPTVDSPVATLARAPALAALSSPPPPIGEQPNAQASEQDLANARQKLLEDLPKRNAPAAEAPVATAALEPSRPAERPAEPAPAAAPAIGAEEVRHLLARAASLVQEGQIGSARALLELASRSRQAAAYLALADTYNPKMLAHWRAIGIRGDEGRAIALYKQAAEGGAPEANARLRELGQ